MMNILGVIGLLAPVLFVIGFLVISRVRERRATDPQAPLVDAETGERRAESGAGGQDE
jgi:hypothetical protein